MSKHKDLQVTMIATKVSPAQKKLLDLLKGEEAQWYAQKLNELFKIGTFMAIDEDCMDIEASCYSYYLLEVLQELACEQEFCCKETCGERSRTMSF